MPSPGTSPLGTDAHPSGIRSCPLDSCSSFCFSNRAGVIPEHLIKRYDVPERVPKGKTGPALHNADTEQKRPRRKDTPALHMPPFVTGKFKKKKSWYRTFTGVVGADWTSLTIWRWRGMACVLALQAALHSGAPREECTYCCLPGFPSLAGPQRQLGGGRDSEITPVSAFLVKFPEPGEQKCQWDLEKR